MESLQEKLEGLYDKLDTLQTTLQMLPDQMILALRTAAATNGGSAPAPIKDVLSDDEEMASRPPTPNGRALSPEAQIQRLTAQLTAAYNRIAALEEQLMARRNGL
jgi:uncharacterized coiled-coil protein SlyX